MSIGTRTRDAGPWSCWIPAVALLLALALLASLAACARERRKPQQPRPVPFQGPAFLRGTVGSLARFNSLQPLLVSGYGMVADLRGKGSEVVPPVLRQRMLQLARKGGLGSATLDTLDLTPERFLDSRDTAVVAVEGLIPPGATRGTRFDLLVTALPQTQVESLAGGRLWTVDMSILGLDPAMNNRPLAEGRGALYVNPFNAADDKSNAVQAVVLAGGVTKEQRVVELTLLEPSYSTARGIADRINERFPRAVGGSKENVDPNDVAVPESPSTIRIHIPRRFAQNPLHLLDLILHLYVQAGPEFEVQKSEELAQLLLAHPEHEADVVAAWQALGRRAKLTLRRYYRHTALPMRLASLEAGARLADDQASSALVELAGHEDPAVRLRVAGLLRHLPDSIPGAQALRRLVDDADRPVRLAAYESLASIDDPSIQRRVFNGDAGPKFVLDLVESERPLVYVGQSPVPRVAVFGTMLGFRDERLISLWDNRLMLRRDGPDQLTVFFQYEGAADAIEQEIRPAVANLVYLMAHRTTVEDSAPGLDLEFSDVAGALFTLCRRGVIEADIELQVNPSARALAQSRQDQGQGIRPDFGALDVEPKSRAAD